MKSITTHGASGSNPDGEHPLRFAARAVDRFFFQPSEPTTLGLMRIAAGILILYVHLIYCIGLTDYLGPYAWVRKELYDYMRKENINFLASWTWQDDGGFYRGQVSYWSIFFHVDDPKWLWVIHISILIVMLLFTLGLWTRVTSVLTWLGSLMYIQRLQGTMLFGLDTMTNLGLFYLMIGPSGAALSLDRWLQVRRQRRRLGANYVPQPPEPMVSATFATRLVQINYCIIYFAAGTSKLMGASWWNATAPNNFLLNYSFAPFDVEAYVWFLKQLASRRWMWELFATFGVVGTLFIELSLPFLVWNRYTRWFMVSCSILFHTMIALLMGLVTFSVMMFVLVLAFVPPEAVRQTLQEWGLALRQLWLGRNAAMQNRQVALSR